VGEDVVGEVEVGEDVDGEVEVGEEVVAEVEVGEEVVGDVEVGEDVAEVEVGEDVAEVGEEVVGDVGDKDVVGNVVGKVVGATEGLSTWMVTSSHILSSSTEEQDEFFSCQVHNPPDTQISTIPLHVLSVPSHTAPCTNTGAFKHVERKSIRQPAL